VLLLLTRCTCSCAPVAARWSTGVCQNSSHISDGCKACDLFRPVGRLAREALEAGKSSNDSGCTVHQRQRQALAALLV
jgi:hypothetical protein